MKNRVVYKYPLTWNSDIRIVMPASAEILCVHLQGKVPTLWAIMDEGDKETIERTFTIVGTGHSAPAALFGRYIGTLLTDNDQFVWHVFECTR